MTTTQLIALLSSPLAPVLVGLIGSGIERLGIYAGWPRIVAFGKMIEAVAADIPKLLSNVKTLAKGEPKGPPPSDPDETVRIIPPLGIFLLLAALVLPTQPSCSSADRSRDIKTAIEGARAACLLYDATKAQLPKPVPEAENLCPVLMARDAVPEPSAATGAGGSP